MPRYWTLFLLVLPSTSMLPGQPVLPDGKGKDATLRMCTKCHTLESTIRTRLSRKDWIDTVDAMLARGAAGTKEEIALVIDYLATHFGKPTGLNKATARETAVGNPRSQEDLQTVVRYHRQNGPVPRPDHTAKVDGVDMRLTDWRHYGRDPGGSQFSTLKQINRSNVRQLRQTWVYHYGAGTSDEGDMGLDYRFAVTPLVINGVMYLSTPASSRKPDLKSAIVALESETGEVIWKYESPRRIHGRGIAYWPGGNGLGPRLFFATEGGYLAAVAAGNGQLVQTFGDNGWVDGFPGVISQDVSEDWRERYTMPNPVTIYRDLVITGARMGERNPPGPRGDIRAWDARTGDLVWTFHTVPQPGEKNHETWPEDSWRNRTGVNMWSAMTVDQERGILFAPLGSASGDFRGADRPGLNLYANSLVALEAATGKLIWYHQITHHDLWDYDLPTPPVLMDVKKNGRAIPAVVQAGKTGLVFVFDRRNGEPVHPIEERPVPQGDYPEDLPSPTQPFPLKPPPLSRNRMTREEISKVTPQVQAHCEKVWDEGRTRNLGPYTLPLKDSATVTFPGYFGGSNWGGASVDPQLGYFFVNLMNFALYRPPGNERGARFSFFYTDGDVRLPCWEPPWGELAAVDVSAGRIVWKVPLGITEALGEAGRKTGTLNLGGNIATAAGLVFIAATNDRRLRAFDAKSGAELWAAELPASGHATPITYLGRDGKQYVAIAAGGGTSIGSKRVSDALVAFALP